MEVYDRETTKMLIMAAFEIGWLTGIGGVTVNNAQPLMEEAIKEASAATAQIATAIKEASSSGRHCETAPAWI